jgi:hypothetical protein
LVVLIQMHSRQDSHVEIIDWDILFLF